MKNSAQIIDNINCLAQSRAGRVIEKGHNLYALDFDAMYTNINLNSFFKVINEDFNEGIRQDFSIEREAHCDAGNC